MVSPGTPLERRVLTVFVRDDNLEPVVFFRILFGERPYWWVHETAHYADSVRPHIEQYPMTCETGPGETTSCSPPTTYVTLGARLAAKLKVFQLWKTFNYKVIINQMTTNQFPHREPEVCNPVLQSCTGLIFNQWC